jgi:DNA-binding beta-propeller fold protein YncE
MPEWALGKPTGITVWKPVDGDDSDIHVFVADTHYHRVMVYRVGEHPAREGLGPADDGMRWGPRVTLVDSFGEYGTQPGQFTYPTDVGVLPTADGKAIQRLYVTEYGGADRVSVFERGGDGRWSCTFTFGQFGKGEAPVPVEFSRPQSIEVDARRSELIIADACNHRIGRFTYEGRLVAWIGGPDRVGPEPGQFAYPYGLSLVGDGTALVAEFGNNRVQRIDLDSGASLGTYGRAGREPGRLATPWAVTAMGQTAFVLDSGNNRVIGFRTPTGGRHAAAAGRRTP